MAPLGTPGKQQTTLLMLAIPTVARAKHVQLNRQSAEFPAVVQLYVCMTSLVSKTI